MQLVRRDVWYLTFLEPGLERSDQPAKTCSSTPTRHPETVQVTFGPRTLVTGRSWPGTSGLGECRHRDSDLFSSSEYT
jgi:hypothetical protein